MRKFRQPRESASLSPLRMRNINIFLSGVASGKQADLTRRFIMNGTRIGLHARRVDMAFIRWAGNQ